MRKPYINGIIVVLAVIAVAAAAGLVWTHRSLPQTSGERAIAGLDDTVRILRDDNGVPHIFAANHRDAYLALGYVHAQDRLWQMEFTRRAGAGRLSEIIGPETLQTDKFLRTLGLYRLAEAEFRALTGPARTAVLAYVAGVNAFIETHEGPWPPEFVILGHKPEAWRPADSLIWAKLMGLRLSSGWQGDLQRANLARKLKTAGLRALFPEDGFDDPTTLSEIDVRHMTLISRAVPHILKSDSASNAWVLDGNRTATGKPILANDPHLGFSAPGIWYLARIVTPDWALTGATVPGVPFHLLGQNRKIAWGFTTTGADTSDLFIELVDSGDPTRYLTPDRPEPFRVREESLQVKGGAPVTLTIRHTRHGPVLSDVLPRVRNIASPAKVVALAATVLQPGDTSVEALYRINHARSVDDVRRAARSFAAPLQNIFAADVDGNIGFVAAGKMPRRSNRASHLPLLGLHGRHDWNGYVAPDRWPQIWNPERGLVANANNRLQPTAPSGLSPYAWTWPAPFRAMRMDEVLPNVARHGVDDSIALQMDHISVAARALLPLMSNIETRSETAANALLLVRSWDFAMDRDRPEPLIYATWTRQLMRLLLADELKEAFSDFSKPRPRMLIRAIEAESPLCDDVTTPGKESCRMRVEDAFDAAITELSARYDNDPASWRWGDAHNAVFPHRILQYLPVVGAWMEGRIETNGGDHTLNRGQTGGAPNNPFSHVHGPGYRAVYDLADRDNSRFSLATGQSGHPLSGHYMSMLRQWGDGRYIRIFGSAADLRARGADLLMLTKKGDRVAQ